MTIIGNLSSGCWSILKNMLDTEERPLSMAKTATPLSLLSVLIRFLYQSILTHVRIG